MTQEDLIESRMLELEQTFRRYLRDDPALRARLPRAVQLVYLAPNDPPYNAAVLARALAAPSNDAAPPRRYVVMTEPPRITEEPPADILLPPAPATPPDLHSPPRRARPGADWPAAAGALVTGELRVLGALAGWRQNRAGALIAMEAACEAELAALRQAGVRAPHLVVTGARLLTAVVLGRTLRRLPAARERH